MTWKAGEMRTFRLGSTGKRRKGKKTRITYRDMQIPSPYDRILCQLITENEHGMKSTSHEVLRRQYYAREVLDRFCEEYDSYKGPIAKFRSAVLSPILQRQLRGLSDSYLPFVARAISNSDGDPTVGEVTELYLGIDPTDPELIPSYRQNMVFVPEMMWHLGIVMGIFKVGDISGYGRVWGNHDVLMADLQAQGGEADCETQGSRFSPAMVKVVIANQVEAFFEPELHEAVCIYPCSDIFLLTNGAHRTLWHMLPSETNVLQGNRDGNALDPMAVP